MEDARGQTASLRLGATASDGRDAEFGASGTVITFRGFLAAYEEGRDDDARQNGDDERRLPPLDGRRARRGDGARARRATRRSPPARYTEASLVKALEDRGIGRPSTYASIMGTILDRGYVFKKGTALVPTFLAFAVTKLLEKHFARLVDYEFTARLEDDLDEIAEGKENRVDWLSRFYRGTAPTATPRGPARARHRPPRGDRRARRELDRDSRRRTTSCCGSAGTARTCSAATSARACPDDMAPDELTRGEGRGAAREAVGRPRARASIPRPGRQVVARDGRYGPYVSEVLEEGSTEKPRTGSLFKTMSLDTITLEDALRLLSLPRTLPRRGRRGDPGRERPLRPVHQEGQGDALARRRGAALHGHDGGGARAARAAEGAPWPRRRRSRR